ncbi:outer membrane assembly protein [gut metagenome]|uniref:Outer membrane assembly protein n=1 Tax=gut metagenome TaxID=749906 RepID=J9GJH8_9ZZZZ
MKKGLYITAAVVGTLLLGMFLLPLAFQGKIADIVKKEGNQMLNAQFDFGKLDLSLFRNFPQASVILEDFWLKGTGEFANDTLVQAGEVTATVNLFSLFGNSGYDISKVSITDTRVHAIVNEDGKANWDVLKAETEASDEASSADEETPFRIKLQQFVVEDLDLVFEDRPNRMATEIRNFNAVCSGDLGSEQTLLKLDAHTQSLTYRLNGIPFLNRAAVGATMDIEADLVNKKFTFKDNTLRLNAIETGIDGWVAMEDPAVRMDLKLNTNAVGFKEILSLIPAIYSTEFSTLKTEGTATMSASLQGVLQGDTVPAFHLDLQVADGMFRYPSLPAGVDRIQLRAQVQNPGGSADLTTVRIEPFSFSLAGNPFSLNAVVQTPVSDPDFKMEAKGFLDLGMIKQVYPLKDMELNGQIRTDMQLAGRLSYMDKEQYDRMLAKGTVELNGMKLKMKDLPQVDIQQSRLTFTPQYLQLSETTLTLGENDLTFDSRFENYMGYALKGTTLKGNLNVRSKQFNLNDFMTSSETTEQSAETTADSTTVATGILEVPRNLDFQMDAYLEQVKFNQMTFQQVKGKLLVREGKIDMQNLSMNTMGGSAVMNGYYATTNPKQPELKGNFQLNHLSFAQAYQELDLVQQMTPLFENLKGNFSGNVHLQTYLDGSMSPILKTMQGGGSLSTRDLSLSGIKAMDQIAEAVKRPQLKNMTVDDMTLHFVIQDGRIETEPFDIRMGEYTMNLSGSTGMDQSIDYSGKIKLPEGSGKLAQLTTFDLKIGGTFDAPKVSLDAKSMATQAVENIADKALEKWGLKSKKDSTRTTPSDSLKQNRKEKVAEKALDFLKKLKK